MTTGTKKQKKTPDSFLADHALAATHLRSILSRIDWAGTNADHRARTALELHIATIAELLLATARTRRKPVGALLNEMALHNAASEMPLLGLALAQLETRSPLPRLLPKNRAAFNTAAATLPTHQRLLHDGAVPTAKLRELADIETDALLPRLARELLGGKPVPRNSTLRLLSLAAHNEPRGNVLLRRARQVQILLAGHDGAALEYREFRKLPAPMRQALLFTPVLSRFFLTPQAQAAARPPSPDFDPLYLEHALAELARGRVSHVDLDTLVLGMKKNPAFAARIVETLAGSRGELACSADVRERLISSADAPELCLIACAAAESKRDVQRAISQLKALPGNRLLASTLYRFALIGWKDAMPAKLPDFLLAHPDFLPAQIAATTQSLLDEIVTAQTHDKHLAGLRFRQCCAWLAATEQAGVQGLHKIHRAAIEYCLQTLARHLSQQGHHLAAEIDGNDLYALYRIPQQDDSHPHPAHVLAGQLRQHNMTRWEHGFFTRIADLDVQAARLLAGASPTPRELEILQQATP